jgi:hypothetical protein
MKMSFGIVQCFDEPIGKLRLPQNRKRLVKRLEGFRVEHSLLHHLCKTLVPKAHPQEQSAMTDRSSCHASVLDGCQHGFGLERLAEKVPKHTRGSCEETTTACSASQQRDQVSVCVREDVRNRPPVSETIHEETRALKKPISITELIQRATASQCACAPAIHGRFHHHTPGQR